MKYGIDIGHNCPLVDAGAVGIRKEDELNKQVGVRVIEKLEVLKHEVVNCTPIGASNLGNSLYKRINKANEEKVDLYVSIHFNAGGGHGTEVFAISKESKEIAKRVVDAIAALGYVNRGVKNGGFLYVLKNTKMPAILVECGFVDSKEDMQRFDAERIANAIVKGLTGCLVNETEIKPSISTELLKVQKELNILNILDTNGKKLCEDGIMGEKTSSAIRRFQGIIGLQINGVVDLKTNDALVNIFKRPLLKFGNNNTACNRYIQWRLNITIDGIFGNVTEKAVLKYQITKKIKADGLVGIITWTRLIM
ncbi:N-acetylmuramoyl-L-alanine amidase [Clostridium sp. CF012]|uniref:N-acetylmuramoyl-L-alanine amidase n=1 Tax=Clostridium sp. CF012 TaxID=2843319 RepID=UPI001C0C6C93|nr:N-acetylmuramoyl-L-alanine amidase [Clostridium sp. CF012]MBU3144726.1 N-acetylmuramoyl-L-alanine amidase [Clostridium sp. CF012]